MVAGGEFGGGFAVPVGGVSAVVVLDRIEPGEPEPDYCLHGRATCMGDCGEWVWLGSETVKVVQEGTALPLCQPCAVKLLAPGTPMLDRIVDHRRADGPH